MAFVRSVCTPRHCDALTVSVCCVYSYVCLFISLVNTITECDRSEKAAKDALASRDAALLVAKRGLVDTQRSLESVRPSRAV